MKCCFLVLLLFGFVSAESKPSSRNKKKGRIVDVDFDDELRIKGKLFGPSFFTVFQKKNINYGKLIKPRKNFLPEMRETLGDID